MHESPKRGRRIIAVGESNRSHLQRLRAYPQSPAGTMDSSRGRKPTEERPNKPGSPEGAARGGLLSCRPFRAPCFVFVTYRGLAPTAKFCRRYAAPQPRMVSSMRLQPRPHSPRCYAAPQPRMVSTVGLPPPPHSHRRYADPQSPQRGRWIVAVGASPRRNAPTNPGAPKGRHVADCYRVALSGLLVSYLSPTVGSRPRLNSVAATRLPNCEWFPPCDCNHGHNPLVDTRLPNRPPFNHGYVISPLRGSFAFTISCGGRYGRWCLGRRRCI